MNAPAPLRDAQMELGTLVGTEGSRPAGELPGTAGRTSQADDGAVSDFPGMQGIRAWRCTGTALGANQQLSAVRTGVPEVAAAPSPPAKPCQNVISVAGVALYRREIRITTAVSALSDTSFFNVTMLSQRLGHVEARTEHPSYVPSRSPPADCIDQWRSKIASLTLEFRLTHHGLTSETVSADSN